MPSNHWMVIQHNDHPWSSLPPESQDREQRLEGLTYFEIKQNPTQVGENFHKPVTEATTINGVIVYITPCRPPGKPLPTNPKMTLKIQHLQEDDYFRLKTLYKYDLVFYLQTNNKLTGSVNRGRKMCVKILDFNNDWPALRFGQQVYDVTMTCRLLPESE